MNKNTRIKLNDGLTMPVVALGVWQSHEGTKNSRTCLWISKVKPI